MFSLLLLQNTIDYLAIGIVSLLNKIIGFALNCTALNFSVELRSCRSPVKKKVTIGEYCSLQLPNVQANCSNN